MHVMMKLRMCIIWFGIDNLMWSKAIWQRLRYIYFVLYVYVYIYILKYSFQWKNENSHWNRIDNLISALNCSYMFNISIIGFGYTLLQTIAFVILQIMMKHDTLYLHFMVTRYNHHHMFFKLISFCHGSLRFYFGRIFCLIASFIYIYIYIYKYIKHSQCNFHIWKREGKKKEKKKKMRLIIWCKEEKVFL